jgi:hypothetical protein
MIRVTALCPSGDGTKFDHDYYVNVYFNTLADFQQGMGQRGKEILADPQMQISEIIG